jgi:hypothetical protein
MSKEIWLAAWWCRNGQRATRIEGAQILLCLPVANLFHFPCNFPPLRIKNPIGGRETSVQRFLRKLSISLIPTPGGVIGCGNMPHSQAGLASLQFRWTDKYGFSGKGRYRESWNAFGTERLCFFRAVIGFSFR